MSKHPSATSRHGSEVSLGVKLFGPLGPSAYPSSAPYASVNQCTPTRSMPQKATQETQCSTSNPIVPPPLDFNQPYSNIKILPSLFASPLICHPRLMAHEPLWTATDLADFLKLSPRTITDLASRKPHRLPPRVKKLPHLRWIPDECRAWITAEDNTAPKRPGRPRRL